MHENVLSTKPVTSHQLQRDLLSLGIMPGDTVMVHASLRSVGSIEGRGEGLVSALLGVLGSGGSLLAYADFEQTSEVPHFDLMRSPARPDYGVFADLVRTHPQAVRSANPGASMVAIGQGANWFARTIRSHMDMGQMDRWEN
jgi:aminoglycoside 3-N-acetyltransferase